MPGINRNIFVLEKSYVEPVSVVSDTTMLPINFTIRDFDIPSGSAAVIYNLQPDGTLVSNLCSVSENTISFDPPAGFFVNGLNMSQIRVTNSEKNLFSFAVKVISDSDISAGNDQEEAEKNPYLISQILSQYGNISGEIIVINGEISNNSNNINELIAKTNLLSSQIAALQNIPSGSTSADAALNDIKIGFDGKEWDTPGDAVRGQVQYLDDTKADASEIENISETEMNTGNSTYYIKFPIVAGGSYTITNGPNNATVISTVNENNSSSPQIESVANPLAKGKTITWTAAQNAEYFKVYTNAAGSINICDNHTVDGKLTLLEKRSRKFNPFFFHSIQSMYSYNSNAEGLKDKIDTWNEIGCDGYIVCLNLVWSNGELTLREDMGLVSDICNYIFSSGKTVAAIKVHCTTYDETQEFKTAYYNFVDNLTSTSLIPTASHTYNYIVFNECRLCLESENEDWCISVINMMISNGVSPSISYDLDLFGTYQVPNDLEKKLGFISLNYYPAIGNKGAATTWRDYINAWEFSRIIPTIMTFKNKYPKLDILITETGVGDYYQNLAYPPKWDMDTSGETPTNGITQGNYLKAAMMTVNDMVYGLTSWYEIDKENTIPILQEMLGKVW